MRNILILTFILVISSCKDSLIAPTVVCTEDANITVNSSHPKAAALQAKMDEFIGKGIPGITVLIADDNGIWTNSAGYADIENDIKMQPCHLNKLGSITKMMVGTLAWQLIQEGLLSIDEPIKTYIPDIASEITNGDKITFGMLLNHTSGIYDVAGDLNFNLAVVNDFSYSWSSEEILELMTNKPATDEPGATVSYSNSNTMIEALIIEAVTGKKHGELLTERILKPLGMNSTVYYDYSDDFPMDRLAQGYLDFNNDGGQIQNISALNPGSGNGYTGVYSTVADLYRFMKALMVDKSLITQESLDTIFASFRLASGGTWMSSVGGIHNEFRTVLSEEKPSYGHGGGDIGYSANLNYLPHNNTIFAGTYNYGTNLRTALREEIGNLQVELMEIIAE
ncbi:MAG: serine hydrolase domain-containing protein [Saprospiraceae bacterium]